MSKLADAMTRATRREARPIGFGSASAQRQATMLVIARVAGAADAAAAAEKGADAVITTSGEPLSGNGSRPLLWGSEAGVQGRDGAKALREAGADFLIFSDDTTDAAVLLEDDLGFVMRIEPDAPDTFLRTVEGLPLDALLMPGLEGALTVRRTLDLRRVAGFARKPLFLPVAPKVEPAVLEALRDCGVIGVVVDGPAAAAALRTRVDGLAPRRKPKDRRDISLMSTVSLGPTRIEEPEEPEPFEPDED